MDVELTSGSKPVKRKASNVSLKDEANKIPKQKQQTMDLQHMIYSNVTTVGATQLSPPASPGNFSTRKNGNADIAFPATIDSFPAPSDCAIKVADGRSPLQDLNCPSCGFLIANAQGHTTCIHCSFSIIQQGLRVPSRTTAGSIFPFLKLPGGMNPPHPTSLSDILTWIQNSAIVSTTLR